MRRPTKTRRLRPGKSLQGKDNEAEDMEGHRQHGKQASLESGLEKKEVLKPSHISPKDFIHWLAAESRVDDDSLRSLFKQ